MQQKFIHKKQWSKMVYPRLAEYLFFEVDPYSWTTKRRYSYRGIALEMYERYGARIHYSTIFRWAHKYGWVDRWESAIREGILKALQKLEEDPEYQRFREELKANL